MSAGNDINGLLHIAYVLMSFTMPHLTFYTPNILDPELGPKTPKYPQALHSHRDLAYIA
jgi:hypothetical protein